MTTQTTLTTQAQQSIAALQCMGRALDEHAIVSVMDSKGIITHVNHRFCQFTGYRRDELVGESIEIMCTDQDSSDDVEAMWQTVSSGQVWTGELSYRTKDGSSIWVNTITIPVQNEVGHSWEFYSIYTDITKQKTLEATVDRCKHEFDQFLYTASHDLKAPLVTIEGSAGFLKQYLQRGQQGKIELCTERILNAAVRMRSNIDDMLQFSRIDRMEGPLESINVQHVVEEVIENLHGQSEACHASIQVEENLPVLFGSRIYIQQIFQNLISNALKYGGSADGKCSISISSEISDGVRFSIADRGAGIEEQYRSQVFELFQRLESGCSGTGIGLAVVVRIVQYYDGSVWIEDTPGGGATFIVQLPLSMFEHPGQQSSNGQATSIISARTETNRTCESEVQKK